MNYTENPKSQIPNPKEPPRGQPQITNPKSQGISKRQNSKAPPARGTRCFVVSPFAFSLGFGICDLGFGFVGFGIWDFLNPGSPS